jgi:hypothetical protein
MQQPDHISREESVWTVRKTFVVEMELNSGGLLCSHRESFTDEDLLYTDHA